MLLAISLISQRSDSTMEDSLEDASGTYLLRAALSESI